METLNTYVNGVKDGYLAVIEFIVRRPHSSLGIWAVTVFLGLWF
jgi:hypothetical protein